MKRFFLPLLWLFASVGIANALEVRIFNVGQGNFIIAKHAKRSLVIDCGKGKNFQFPRKNLADIARSYTRDTSSRICITHNHLDHRDLLETIKGVVGDPPLGQDGVLLSYDKSRDEIVRFCSENPLGDDVKVICLLPENWDELREAREKKNKELEVVQAELIKISSEIKRRGEPLGNLERDRDSLMRKKGLLTDQVKSFAHKLNLVLKITYDGRSILFPGDATSDGLSFLSEEDLNELRNIHCIIVPHHGSVTEGSSLWLAHCINARKNRYITRMQKDIARAERESGCCHPHNYSKVRGSVLQIVSSDPEGNDGLPKSILYSTFNDESKDAESVHEATPLKHSIKLYEPKQTKQNEVILRETDNPFFVTCCAEGGYYDIIVNKGKSLRLRDGRKTKDNESADLYKIPVRRLRVVPASVAQ